MPTEDDKKKPMNLSEFNAQAEKGAIDTIASTMIVLGTLKASRPDTHSIVSACRSFSDDAKAFKQNVEDFAAFMAKVDPKSVDAKTAAEIQESIGVIGDATALIPDVTGVCLDALSVIQESQEQRKAPPQQRPAPAPGVSL